MSYPDHPNLKEFSDHTKPAPRNRLFRRIFYELLAWASMVFLLLCAFITVFFGASLLYGFPLPLNMKAADSSFLLILVWVIAQTVLFLGYYFGVRFIYKRLFLPLRYKARNFSGQQLKQLYDQRQHILYLRSFRSDEDRNLVRRKSEIALVSLLKEKGPVIAVGRPGETVPPMGAVRLYFDDSEWQEKVKVLIARSQFVVIQVAYSTGLVWEILTAINLLGLERVLFYVGHWNEMVFTAANTERELFIKELNETCNVSLRPDQLINAIFILFDRDRKPHIYKSDNLHAFFGHQSKTNIRKAFKQMVEENEMMKLGLSREQNMSERSSPES